MITLLVVFALLVLLLPQVFLPIIALIVYVLMGIVEIVFSELFVVCLILYLVFTWLF